MGCLEIFTQPDSLSQQTPEEVTDGDIGEIERFVVLLYSCTSQVTTVNAARKQFFSYGNRKLENIPPSRAALLQHAKRASFQAGDKQIQLFQVLQNGVGRRTMMETGHHCGPRLQKLLRTGEMQLQEMLSWTM